MKPERNPAYLKFVRGLPCCVCGKTWGIEAAHTGPHGLSQKAPDAETIPLCRLHHTDPQLGLDRIGRAAFEDLHGVSVARLVQLTQRRAAACRIGAQETTPQKKQPARAGAISGLRGSRLAR